MYTFVLNKDNYFIKILLTSKIVSTLVHTYIVELKQFTAKRDDGYAQQFLSLDRQKWPVIHLYFLSQTTYDLILITIRNGPKLIWFACLFIGCEVNDLGLGFRGNQFCHRSLAIATAALLVHTGYRVARHRRCLLALIS